MNELKVRPYTLLPSGQCYDRSEVDAYIAELTSENKLLKERISNGDVSRISWIDEAIEWKAKYESAKATAYADSVDAGMRERELKAKLCHANYKRCIALASLCHWNVCDMNERFKKECIQDCKVFYLHRASWWSKWERRWLAIAEKFKEGV